MSTLTVIVERTDNNYSAFLLGIDGIVATGNSVEEIKTNMVESINAFIEDCQEFGLQNGRTVFT